MILFNNTLQYVTYGPVSYEGRSDCGNLDAAVTHFSPA